MPNLHSIFATVLVISTVASAQSPTDLPPSQHAILTVTGKGVQIYACQQSAGTPQWVFQAPEATLLDAHGNSVGTHGGGPSWKSSDGSEVKGELVQKNPSPEAGSIPWLLLKATSVSGSGIMSHVEYIRRFDTHGGTAPATGCDSQHLATTVRVPYTATYAFYSARP
jgi:Protein of unknown function (DUF3455)